MIEQDVRSGLQDAVGDEPPLNFDPDALVATAERQLHRRRALLGVGVATVAVAVAAVALPSALGRAPTQVADSPTSTVTPSASVEWPPNVSPVTYTTDQLRHRGDEMRKRLLTAVPEVLTGASDIEYGQFGGEAEGQYYDGQDTVNTHVSFSIDGKRYSIFVQVWAPGAMTETPTQLCAADGGYCRHEGRQDSGLVVAKSVDLGEETLSSVYHFRDSGALTSVTAYNYDMASRTMPTYLPAIPVTFDQLTRLATDPELGL
jgi:hypothetical protein